MSFFDSEYSNNENESLQSRDLLSNIKTCKEIIREGNAFINKTFLEETAEECIDSMRYRDALFIIENILKMSPYDSELWLNRGICLSNLKQKRKALKSIDRALSYNPGDVDALIEKASVQISLKNFDDAKDSLNRALEIEPKNEMIYFRFAKLFQQKGMFDKAVEYLNLAIKLDTEFSDAYFQLAICYEYDGDFNSALNIYNEYLNLEPNCEVGWFNRGIVLENLEQFEKAIDSYELAIAIDDYFSDAWFNLGNLFADLGRYEKGIECFQRVVQIEKHDEASYYNIATIYEEMERFELAIKYYTRAIKRDDQYHEAFLGRGYCSYKLGKVKSSIRDFGRALGSNYFSDVVWSKKESSENAVDETVILKINKLTLLLQKDPANIFLLTDLASNYVKINNLDKGIELFFKVLTIQPKNPICYFSLAEIYFKKELVKHGFYYLKRAMTLDIKLIDKFAKSFPVVYTSKLFKVFMEDKKLLTS
jgi:tetratricopeptide (TPR) repeat protein